MDINIKAQFIEIVIFYDADYRLWCVKVCKISRKTLFFANFNTFCQPEIPGFQPGLH